MTTRIVAVVILVWALCGGPGPARGDEQGIEDAVCAFSDRYPAEVPVQNAAQARSVVAFGIDVDAVRLPGGPDRPGTVHVYVNPAERAQLEQSGFTVMPVRNTAKETWRKVAAEWERTGAHAPAPAVDKDVKWNDWYTPTQLGAELQALADAHPDLVQLITIGDSVQGRPIWFVKISDNVDVEENEPEFKFSSTIHGDEVTGMELCRRMIHYLVDNYGSDAEVTNLVNGAELWFCPLHNPDGYANGTRYNANGKDLNREFPDPMTDPHDSPAGRPREVQHMMNFQYPRNFILGVNYHGGALVVNLPWDYKYADPPDNDLFWHLGEGYAKRNPPLWNSTEFTHGVTNGADWYIVHGGFQDWAYNWRNELHITIEVSTTKWPAYSQMNTFWAQNRESMLWLMRQTLTTGITGTVTDSCSGGPLAATVTVKEIGKPIISDTQVGDYHRLLRPGTYTVEYSHPGYPTRTLTGVRVSEGLMTLRDVALDGGPCPRPGLPWLPLLLDD